MNERCALLLGIFACAGRSDDGRPSTGALRAISGLSWDQLSPTYNRQRRPTTIAKIATAAAGLLGLNPDRLLRWLEGKQEPQIEAQINRLARLRRCAGCHEFFDMGEIDQDLYRCSSCRRSPAVNDWIAKVEGQIAAAPQPLRQAWSQAKVGGQKITYGRMAELLGQTLEAFQAAWQAAGLPARPIPGRPRRLGRSGHNIYNPNRFFSKIPTVRTHRFWHPDQLRLSLPGFGGEVAA